MNLLNTAMMMLSAVDYEGINIFKGILLIFMVIVAIATIVVVLMQKGTSDNIGVIGGETDTYMGRNKGQNKEKKLKLATAILGGIFVVMAFIYFILSIIWFVVHILRLNHYGVSRFFMTKVVVFVCIFWQESNFICIKSK